VEARLEICAVELAVFNETAKIEAAGYNMLQAGSNCAQEPTEPKHDQRREKYPCFHDLPPSVRQRKAKSRFIAPRWADPASLHCLGETSARVTVESMKRQALRR
jgi:hypothetical protein